MVPLHPSENTDMLPDDPNELLFFAIGFSQLPGVESQLGQIAVAVGNGADIEGFDENGRTPLTHAIESGMGSPKAVKTLLGLGADPSARDKNGWTPWALCLSKLDNPVLAKRVQKIRELLEASGAVRGDEVLIEFDQAVGAQDQEKVKQMLGDGINVNAPIISPVWRAIDNGDLGMMNVLLGYGAKPDSSDDDPETLLMHAARAGNLDIVKRLVEAGADPFACAYEDAEWTAEYCAEEAGQREIAQWLREGLPAAVLAKRQAELDARNPKYAELYEKNTNGINCGLTTDDVVKKLEQWDARYTIEISEIDNDRLNVKFFELPDDLAALAREIYDFCPDVIEQGFGVMDEMVNMMEETGMELPREVAEIIEGIDFADDDFGLELLQRSLRATKDLGLWWD